MLNTVDDAVITGTIFLIALPLPFQKLPKTRMKRKPVNGFGDLFAELLVGTDKAIKFLLSEMRKNYGVTNRHK